MDGQPFRQIQEKSCWHNSKRSSSGKESSDGELAT
jgi:hypothetical protein